jgi:hypothetical protein
MYRKWNFRELSKTPSYRPGSIGTVFSFFLLIPDVTLIAGPKALNLGYKACSAGGAKIKKLSVVQVQSISFRTNRNYFEDFNFAFSHYSQQAF